MIRIPRQPRAGTAQETGIGRGMSLRLSLALGMGIAALGLGGCAAHKPKIKATPTVGNRIPVLSHIESGTKVDTALASMDVVVPAPEVNSQWAQGGGTASKASGHLALADAPRKVWSVRIAGSSPQQRLGASPVVGGGLLYAMDTKGIVHAFDDNTGREKWQQGFRLPKKNDSIFGGGVSFDEGSVYITTGLGEVAALDATDGKIKWRVKPAGPLRGAPTVAFGAVYVMTQDNQILALNIADGTSLWNESASTTQSGVFGVAAPAAGQGTVIAGYSSGELVAYRYENGRQLWSDALARTSIATSVSTITDIDADPIIESGHVYALGQGGRMAAYELVSGQRIWELNLAGISTPAVAGEWIFTLTDEAKLLCIAKASGKVRWMSQLPRYVSPKKKEKPIFWTGPVLAGNKLWAANSRGQIVKVTVGDGTMAVAGRVNAPVTLAPIVADKTLYVLDDSGAITAWR